MRVSYTRLYFHLIWGTWKRWDLIDSDMEPVLFKVIRAKCGEKGCKAIIVGGTTNHIHLLVELRSTISVSDLVQFIKGSSAYIIARQMKPEVFFKWQGGYGAITVSPQNIPLIKKYIASQKEHHQTGSLNHHWELESQPSIRKV